MRLPPRRGLLLIAGALALTAWIYRPLFAGALLLGRDAFRLFLPARAFLLESLSRGELPLWNPYLRLGQPFAASLLPQAFYPPSWITTLLFGPAGGLTVQQVLHVLLAAAGAWWAARTLRCSPLAAVVAGVAFGFSPLLTDLNGHRNVVDAAAWSGWMVGAAVRLSRLPRRSDAVLLAGATTLSFFAGSPETLLWQLLLVAAVVLSRRPTPEAWKAIGGSALLCLGLAAVLLLPAIEFLRLTTRGAGSADSVDWSASWAQLLAMGWPRAELPKGEYWGDDQWWMVTVFVGTLPCLLALAALRRSRRVLALALVTAMFAALALGKHLPPSAWLWTHGPLGAFRFPAKFLVGVAFGVALLAAFGTDRLSTLLRRRSSAFGWLGGAIGLGILGLLVGPPLLRLLGARPGATQGLLWVLGAGVALAVAVFAPGVATRRRVTVRASVLAVLVLELALHHGLNTGFGWEKPRRLESPSVLAAAIPEGFQGRVSLAITDARVGPRDPSLPSFIDTSRDALVPNRHMEEGLRALEGYGAPEPRWMDEFQLIGKRSVFDLTGVAYYLRAGAPPYPDLEPVAEGPGLPKLYRSSTAMPRAFVVHRAEVVDEQTALARVWHEAQPTRETVFLQEGAALDAPCQGSTARIVTDSAQRVEVEVHSCGPGYLVLSDTFFPGWRASVDGESVPLLRADYALRAVPVRPGPQRVAFLYRPGSFLLGALVSALSLGVLAWRLFSRPRGPAAP